MKIAGVEVKNMSDYIEREDAINLLWLFADESCASVVSDFENLPAADVEPIRHGHWCNIGSLSCRCSECGCKSSQETAYCPNCGARMDKEDEHETD